MEGAGTTTITTEYKTETTELLMVMEAIAVAVNMVSHLLCMLTMLDTSSSNISCSTTIINSNNSSVNNMSLSSFNSKVTRYLVIRENLSSHLGSLRTFHFK